MTTDTPTPKTGVVQSSGQFSTFFVADLFFGVDVLNVQEVLRFQPMTPVPQAPEVIEGLINLLDMDDATYERTPENLDPAARDLIRGVYKLKDRLLLVLDAERTVDLAAGRAP